MKKQVRLPSHTVPICYEIFLKPDFKTFNFEGKEKIELALDIPIKTITLHAKELKIEAVIFTNTTEKIKAQSIKYDAKKETVTFSFAKLLPVGKGELSLKFNGVLNEHMRGFYRSRYLKDGKECWMATTQFESTDARRAFPCVDEPAAKAVFDVTLMVPDHCTAISNTIPTEVQEHESGYKIMRFAPTPKMSTYLLAFIVGEFEYVEGKTKEGVLVRVFTTPGKKKQAHFALEVAIKTLSFFNEYFAIPYPLPVLDLIAIPDFSSGAMENWGAITYREAALLVDPEHSSAHTKQWVALVIAHELAHQWFGNLVTMEWWTHLWLNEGFASYIEYLAVDHLFPEWDIWTQFVTADLGSALRLDALQNTHPIEIAVHHPNEIDEIFDAVSYSKGASVIRMLASYLGEKDFRNGLRHYLKRHSYSNATTDDLWFALEHASGKPVKEIMDNWTRKPGYPILNIKQKMASITVEQSRFFSSPLSRAASKDKMIWSIPIRIRRETSGVPEMYFLKKQKGDLAIPKDGWIKFNAGETSLARVDYPKEWLLQFQPAIKNRELPAADRLGIIRDAFALTESGQSKTSEVLMLLDAYRSEDNYTVWSEIASNLSRLNSLLAHQPFSGEYKKFARNIFSTLADRMNWQKQKKEQHIDTLLRNLALSNFGFYGDAATIKKAQSLFRHPKKIDPDFRGLIYALVAENGGTKEYQQILDLYRQVSMSEEQNRLAAALGLFPEEKLLQKTLEFSLSSEVRLQDSVSVISHVMWNPHGEELAWGFIQTHWQEFLKRYGQGGHFLTRLAQLTNIFRTEARAKEIQQFFRTHKAPGAERTIQQVLERVRSNAAWLARDQKDLQRFLL
ncbi:MAG TPA: M1 family metallopeptidase [Candidatus Paceibacterota bacterium]